MAVPTNTASARLETQSTMQSTPSELNSAQRTSTVVYLRLDVSPVAGCVNRLIRHAANQEQSSFCAE
eukprot:scaffold39311_cov67-Phaeocystis_antarctica.AAC.4